MFYHLCISFVKDISILNLFKYITFRSACAFFSSFIIALVIFPYFIKFVKNLYTEGQPIREDGPQTHMSKCGTPTLGGIVIIIVGLLSSLFWSDLTNKYLWIVWGVIFVYSLLGFYDDYKKLKHRNSKGITAKVKFILQFITGCFATVAVVECDNNKITGIIFPFLKDYVLELSFLYIIFGSIVIVGSSNAVNLTDGLDGLSVGPIAIILSYFALINYIVGNSIFSNYLQIHHVPGACELSITCSALVGSCIAFLWYNAMPAKIFMGDVGSLALGGCTGILSVVTKHEIALFFAGGLFVIEALSVIIQVGYFKIYKKRVFKMAPIHHHFEKCGWSESTIVIRFWIIALLCGLFGLIMLKLRCSRGVCV